MTGRDWGGRRKINPDNIKRVNREDVEKLAKELGIEVRRDGPGNGTWWVKCRDGIWRTAGMTNYFAYINIRIVAHEPTELHNLPE